MSDKLKRKGILVIQSMGLGDVFFALPVIQVLKRRYPEDPIIFVTHERHREILEMIPAVSEITTYERKTPFELMRLYSKVNKLKPRMAVVLNPIFRGSILAWASGAEVRLGYARDYEKQQFSWWLEKKLLTHTYSPREEKMHEVDRYLDLLQMYGVPVTESDKKPRLPILKVKRGAEVLAVINVGTGWKMRQWPDERIAMTADFLKSGFGAKVIFCGGLGDKVLADSIQSRMRTKAENLCGKTSLKEFAEILSACDLFITPDTGSLHLAAAMDIPTIALFGPGDLVKVRPRSEKVKVLYHHISCSPCRFQYTDKCGNNLCMQEITVGEVMKAVETFLNPLMGKGAESELCRDNKTTPPKPKKILYLQSTSEISGTDVTLLRTLQALNKNKFEPHVILHKEGPFTKSYQDAGAKVHIVTGMRKLTKRKGAGYLFALVAGYFPAVFQIKRIICWEKIDIVHTNTIHNLYGFLAALFAGVPHIWHVREIVVQSRLMKEIEIRLVKWFSARFLVMNNAIAESFLGKDRGFPANIIKLYDGLDLEKFKPGKPSRNLRTEIGIPETAPLVGIVCRLDPWKGLDLFLEAAARVHAQLPEACFWVCGGEIEGHEGYEAKLKKKALDLGIEKAVYFTGWRYKGETIMDVYRSLDVSVQCPAFPEPYGLVNLEAMASGIPVAAFAEGGPLELCGESALLVPPRDAERLAEAVVKILKDTHFAQSLKEKGRRRVEAFFDFKKCTSELEKIYSEILKNGERS